MAASECILVALTSFLLFACNAQQLELCGFDAIYQLGDSYLDTGNYIQVNPFITIARLPYGQTLGKPTGRCSDGLLIIDYFSNTSFHSDFTCSDSPKV